MPLTDTTDLSDPNDPTDLFYKGKTPVLGQDVTLRTGGALPGEFPAAGPGPAPTAPTAPSFGPGPAPPNFDFPGFSFEFGEPPEFTGVAPGARPLEGFGPGAPGPSWFDFLRAGGDQVSSATAKAAQLRKAGQAQLTQGPGQNPNWMAEGDTSFNPYGFNEGSDWWTGGGPKFSVSAPEAGPTLSDPASQFNLGQGDLTKINLPTLPGEDAARSGLNVTPGGAFGTGMAAAQTGLGIYNAINAPTPGGKALSAFNAAGGAAGTVGGLAAMGVLPEGLAALAPISPAVGLATLPIIAGQILSQLRHGGEMGPKWPKGFMNIPDSPKGRGARAVDPSTGRVVEYGGHGRYRWTDETQKGQIMKPEDFLKYEIEPTGELAKQKDYAGLPKQIRDVDINRGMSGKGAPTQAHQTGYFEEQRQSDIDKIRQANPDASDAEVWHQYSTSQDPNIVAERQRQQALQDWWNPQQERGNQ